MFDGQEVLESAMQLGVPGCWPDDFKYSKDFVVRGVYAPQLLHYLRFFAMVSTLLSSPALAFNRAICCATLVRNSIYLTWL